MIVTIQLMPVAQQNGNLFSRKGDSCCVGSSANFLWQKSWNLPHYEMEKEYNSCVQKPTLPLPQRM